MILDSGVFDLFRALRDFCVRLKEKNLVIAEALATSQNRTIDFYNAHASVLCFAISKLWEVKRVFQKYFFSYC